MAWLLRRPSSQAPAARAARHQPPAALAGALPCRPCSHPHTRRVQGDAPTTGCRVDTTVFSLQGGSI